MFDSYRIYSRQLGRQEQTKDDGPGADSHQGGKRQLLSQGETGETRISPPKSPFLP